MRHGDICLVCSEAVEGHKLFLDGEVGPFCTETCRDEWRKDVQGRSMPERISALGKRSAERVAKNAEFAEVATRIEKAKKAKGVVKLGDLMATADKPKDGAGADDPDDEEEKRRKKGELTPQAKEALNILAELAAGN